MTDSQGIEFNKRRLRAEMFELRARVEGQLALEAGSAMARALIETSAFATARSVGLFASLEDEPATQPIFEALRERDRSCFFPRCRDDGGLDLIEIGAWRELEPGRYGILEPPDGRLPMAPENLDLILVPGVAFDARGGRLGRGGGFYDRVLPRAGEPGSATIFGLAFAFQIVDRVPADERDRPVDAILTEEGLNLADRDF